MPSLCARTERWPIRGGFTISRGTKTEAEVVVAELTAGEHRGRGECVPYARYGERVEQVVEAIESLRADVANGLDRAALAEVLPAGAARNAVDCAFWDIEAKRSGRRAHELAGLPVPGRSTTAYTLSLAAPEVMREAARAQAQRPLIKVKLGGEGDIERLAAVREGAPDSRIIVDANEGWDAATYTELAPTLAALGVALVEQPLHANEDAALDGIDRPVPVCADESCHDLASLPALIGRYDVVNIKLDKTGGLTEALRLREAALAAGMRVMVGSMLATSLAMAPALLVAEGADFVDLDGPLLLERDRVPGLRFEGSEILPAEGALWG